MVEEVYRGDGNVHTLTAPTLSSLSLFVFHMFLIHSFIHSLSVEEEWRRRTAQGKAELQRPALSFWYDIYIYLGRQKPWRL